MSNFVNDLPSLPVKQSEDIDVKDYVKRKVFKKLRDLDLIETGKDVKLFISAFCMNGPPKDYSKLIEAYNHAKTTYTAKTRRNSSISP